MSLAEDTACSVTVDVPSVLQLCFSPPAFVSEVSSKYTFEAGIRFSFVYLALCKVCVLYKKAGFLAVKIAV